jgi:hypothetical protein
MKLLPPLVIAATLLFGSCASDDGKGVATQAQKPDASGQAGTGKVIPVEIVVGSKPDLDKRCADNAPPTTVFVVNPKEVYHCIKGKLLDHDEHDKGNPAMAISIVQASTGDRIRWYSNTHSFTVSVVKHPKLGPQHPDAPDTPFPDKALLVSPAREKLSSLVPEALKGKIQQRYKVSFNIDGVGLVDPDLICTMF